MISSVIPVAGVGTRSLPLSKAVPKEMTPVFDRPIIQRVVEEAVASDAGNVILVTSKGKTAIEDHFDISSDLEALLTSSKKNDLYQLVYSVSRMINVQTVRQKTAQGLGHAVLMAKHVVSTPHFAVLLGDDLVEAPVPGIRQLRNFQALLGAQSETSGVVLLMEVTESEVSKYGICGFKPGGQGLVSRCIEKPKPAETSSRMAIIGRYLLPRDIFDILESQKPGALGEIQLTDALNVLAAQGRLYGQVLKGRRFDAGDRLGFLEANLYYYLQSSYAPEVRKLIGALLK